MCFAAAAVVAAAALSGCQSMSMNSAQIRVVDASPDAGTIDSYQDSSAIAYNLNHGTVTSYVPIPPGTSNFGIDKAGTRQTLATTRDALAPGKQYTAIVTGSLANLQQTILSDQSTPAPSGQIALRFLNESIRPAALDVYLVPLQSRLSSLSPITANLAPGLNEGYFQVPVGTYAVDVLPAGTPPTSSASTLLSGAQVEYASGSVRTIVLIDRQAATASAELHTPALQALVADDADGP
jgi:hypothetical protein